MHILIYLTMIIMINVLNSCTSDAVLFRKNAAGTYKIVGEETTFSIDDSGDIAGAPNVMFIFYQALSDHDAVYVQRIDFKSYYLPFRIDGDQLYKGNLASKPQNTDFKTLKLYAVRIR